MYLRSVAVASGPADWKKEDAGKYLDSRAKAWFDLATAGRGEGVTQSSCLCCTRWFPIRFHVLRSESRWAMGNERIRKATPGADQNACRKLGSLDTTQYQLLYDFNDQKKKESWGTEAVLNALILAFDDHYTVLPHPGRPR